MRYFYTICLLLILSSLHLSAQDEVSCTSLNQMTSIAASIGIQSSGEGACADAVDLSSFQVEAGTPDAICEQATPAISPDVVEWDEAEEVLEDGVDYQAIFCTDVGAIHFELFEEDTPLAVNNLVFLAQNNYYNNTIFHRVIEDFMAQGGDPTGTGRGNPGYDFDNEIVGDLTFDRPYLLAMANAGPDTNGSQFFITFVETPHLDGGYTIFGEVISGQDVVDDIMFRDPTDLDADGTVLYAVVIVSPEQVLQQ